MRHPYIINAGPKVTIVYTSLPEFPLNRKK
jgi:hypothetical protein